MFAIQDGHHEDIRKVWQFFIKDWLDFEANLSPEEVYEFVSMVRQEARRSCYDVPMTVHCRYSIM